ncbi:unnamed protein product [Auanema sp. JU1783]|nr:unnamed protein product [Auanema sp. JU1783]
MSVRTGILPGSSSLASTIMGGELENHVRILQDSNQRDDLKLRSLQEILSGFEVLYPSASFPALLESLIKVFVKLLTETQPQFISENNTHLLRKQILEIILRSSTHEAMKPHIKDITRCLMKLIMVDNEENAILAVKIVTDIGKNPSFKMHFHQEQIQTVTGFCKQLLKDMKTFIYNGMFETRDLGLGRQSLSPTDETLIEMCLVKCYFVQPVTLTGASNGRPGLDNIKYNLIPRASQSIKLIQELTMLFVFFYQHYKSAVLTECLEYLQLVIQFAGLQIPQEQKESSAYNKGIADEFCTSQVRALCYVNIMGKLPQFMEILQTHSVHLITALFCHLENLPTNLTVIRKEVLMTLKFLFGTELRLKFLPYLTRLLCEETMLGTGFTSADHLRIFMYQILADLLHHIRSHLTFPMLAHIVCVFSRTMNDNSISPQVQIMCVRLLNSVSETMGKLEQQGDATRDVLLSILESVVIKLKLIATYHLPQMFKLSNMEGEGKSTEKREYKSITKPSKLSKDDSHFGRRVSLDTVMDIEDSSEVIPEMPLSTKHGRHTSPGQILTNLWTIHTPPLSVTEARNLVKYIMQTCKFCTAQLVGSRRSNVSMSKMKERDVFERLFLYSTLCMEVFILPLSQPSGRANNNQNASSRSKEEKEALEAMAAVFTSIDPDIFRELFAKYIDFLIEGIHRNPSIQMLVNTFLVRADWSCKFGSILLKNLMEKLNALSMSTDKTGLYVKLFKIIFSAIGCSQPQSSPDGELMLKPYLSDLIRKSTEFALHAREPLNFFLLLRALFRSIGGGAHDILYVQFLPLLPNLLQFLNMLQSCPHRQPMRELFLELCLTVPVRLSSLLPYLPLLMDPLVCALSGSSSLVQQGLRTLELCVDNLQPEYLFEHMAPVRGALMQGLWRVLSTSTDMNSASIAFRILGKFGGANRRMLSEPQQLKHVLPTEYQSVLTIQFDRAEPNSQPLLGELSLSEILVVAVEQMKTCIVPTEATTPGMPIMPSQLAPTPNPPHSQIIRQHCMEIAHGVLLTGLGPIGSGDDWKSMFVDNLKEQFKMMESTSVGDVPVYKCIRSPDRKLFVDALSVLFIGVVGKDLRNQYLKFFNAVVRQLTIQGILEYISRDLLTVDQLTAFCLDASVLVDALVAVLSDSNKDYLHSAIVALCHINETCKTVLPNPDTFIRIPMVRYLLEQVCTLCYGPSWFSRLGGGSALNYMIENYPLPFLKSNLHKIVKSLVEVIIGLLDEISSGAVDMALNSLLGLHKRVFVVDDLPVVEKCPIFVRVYSTLLFHPCEAARAKGWQLMNNIVSLVDCSMKDVIERCADDYSAIITNTFKDFQAMSMTNKISALDSLYSLYKVYPEITKLGIHNEIAPEFLGFVLDICGTDIPTLSARDIYKAAESCPAHFLPPYPISQQMESMRANAMRIALACYGISRKSSAVEVNSPLSETERKILRLGLDYLLDGSPTSIESVRPALIDVAPLPPYFIKEECAQLFQRLSSDTEFESVDVLKLYEITRLNPDAFTKEIAQSIVDHICRWEVQAVLPDDIPIRTPEDLEAIHIAFKLLLMSEVTEPQMVHSLLSFAVFFEANYSIDGPIAWIPVLCELLSKWPEQSVKYLMREEFFFNYANASYIKKIMKQDESEKLREYFCNHTEYFEKLLDHFFMNKDGEWVESEDKTELSLMIREETTLYVLDTVSRQNLVWFTGAHGLVNKMRQLWNSAEFKLRYSVRQGSGDSEDRRQIKVQMTPCQKYKVPALMVNCFIRYLRRNREYYDLLFDILFVFDNPYATDFGFLKDFIEKEIIPCCSLAWRQEIFNLVLQKFETQADAWQKNTTMARIVQYLLIPCLHWAFERYNVDEVLGPAPPANDSLDEDPNSIVSRLASMLDRNRSNLGDKNVIVFYQLCTLLVEYAPEHIHNNACKKQGSRLRVFMLFAWPCLTTGSLADPTLRFTGFLFLAHIIDRFTINRKIVLQVFHTLAATYQIDNREQVKRAVDVLTPAVPIRMDDGHQQILATVKKILREEAHNLVQTQHIIQMIIRNYRVYYHIRHDLLPTLLQSVQRSIQASSGLMEGFAARRLGLDVCEMIIKWDLLRNRMLENTGGEAQDEVESVLEALKSSEKDEKKENSVPERHFLSINQEYLQTVKEREDNNLKAISKEHVDTVVNMLLKFACSFQPAAATSHQNYASSAVEMAKRSLGLLRAALKPVVWGETVTIRVQWIERQLNIPPDFTVPRQDHHPPAQNMHLQQAQQTLEVLYGLTSVMPKHLLLQVIRPIQRAIISCLNSNYPPLVRTVNYLVARLFEKTKVSVAGLDELEIFNQYIAKYLNDQFNNFFKSPNSSLQSLFTAFTMLRSICSYQEGYLDSVCLPTFLKVLERSVREHCSMQGVQDSSREKGHAEVISLAMELLRPRIDAVSLENRRIICQNVLLPLMEKSNYEKVIEGIIKMTQALIMTHKDELKGSANPGLPLAVRLYVLLGKRYRYSPAVLNSSLMNLFLQLALTIFDNKLFCSSDYATKMEEAFYWGLMSPDVEIRNKFLNVWERKVKEKPFVFDRLLFLMEEQNWSNFREYYWLKHALWILLRTIPLYTPESMHKKACFMTTSNFWQTLQRVGGFKDIIPSLGAVNLAGSIPSSRTPSAADGESLENEMEVDDKIDTLLVEQRSLISESACFDMASQMDSITGLIFSVPDTKYVAKIWTQMFCSLWLSMTLVERKRCSDNLESFLSSGTHNHQTNAPHSVLRAWLEVVSRLYPEYNLPPRLIQFIAGQHHGWHRGALMLENAVLNSQCRMVGPDGMPMEQTEDQKESLYHLSELYRDLDEMDQFAGVWGMKACRRETHIVLEKVQMGEHKAASELIENMLVTVGEEVQQNHATPTVAEELELLFDVYTTCCQELMEWEKLRDFANSTSTQSAKHLMIAAMHIPDLGIVKECRDQLSGCVPPKFAHTYSIYNAMLNVMTPDSSEPGTPSAKSRMERALEEATTTHIIWWRSLPSIVTNAHVKILQAMSMIREVTDCTELKTALDSTGNVFNGNILNEMKNVIKIWRNRTPGFSDDMLFISDLYNWRCQVHSMLAKRFEDWERGGVSLPHGTTSQAILPIHSAAQGQVFIARAARNMRHFDLAIEQLTRLHTMVTVPLMDAHFKVCEHIKTLRAQAEDPETDPNVRLDLLKLGLHLIDEVNITDCHKDQICRLYTMKGSLLSLLEMKDESNLAFSQAGQLYEGPNYTPGNTGNVFKAWGNHMDRLFHAERDDVNGLTSGTGAIACFLEAARTESEPKARKYIARLLWTSKLMAACSPAAFTRLEEQIKRHERTTVAYNWLSWIPELLLDIQQRKESPFLLILARIAQQYPIQVFYYLRSVVPADVILHHIDAVCSGLNPEVKGKIDCDEDVVVLLPVLRDVILARPTDIRAFHRFLSELDELREFWAEKHFRYANQLKSEILRCLNEQRHVPQSETVLDQKALDFIAIWKECVNAEMQGCISEELLEFVPNEHRAQSKEACFVREASHDITTLLDAPPAPGSLLRFLEAVLKITNRLYKRVKRLPKRIPLQILSEFLTNLNHKVACVEMPSDMLNVLKNGQYVSMISRIDPYIELDFHAGEVVRKMSIRAQTGKICHYYIRRSVCKDHKINRCQQYLNSLNALLAKERETSRRHLSVYCPTQLRVGKHCSLIETAGVVANTAEAPTTTSPILHPMEILSETLVPLGMRPDDVIAMFYDRLSSMSECGIPTVDMRARAFSDLTVDEFISSAILVRHFLISYPDPTHYYMAKKQIVHNMAILFIVEWLAKLSPVALQDIWINKYTGQFCNPDYTFDIDMKDEDRHVPFRLSPNFNILFGLSVGGDLTWSAKAVVKCLQFRRPELMLRPMLLDHISETRGGDKMEVWNLTNDFVNKFLGEIKNISSVHSAATMRDVPGLLIWAGRPENLCNVNPALHPWF